MAGGATDARSLSRGEFGPRVGVPRLLELCERLGIAATFFTPGHTADTYPETTAEITRQGHEIAAHGYVHEDFEKLSLDEARASSGSPRMRSSGWWAVGRAGCDSRRGRSTGERFRY